MDLAIYSACLARENRGASAEKALRCSVSSLLQYGMWAHVDMANPKRQNRAVSWSAHAIYFKNEQRIVFSL